MITVFVPYSKTKDLNAMKSAAIKKVYDADDSKYTIFENPSFTSKDGIFFSIIQIDGIEKKLKKYFRPR